MFHISLRTLQCDPSGILQVLAPPPPHQLTVRVTQQLHVGQFQMVCQFKEEIDKSAPPPTVPWFYSHFRSPTKNLTDRICGVSMLQIFEPFSRCRNAYTGKLNERGGLCRLTILYTFFRAKRFHSLKPQTFVTHRCTRVLTTYVKNDTVFDICSLFA